MNLADTLSRAFIKNSTQSSAEEEAESVHASDFLPISEPQLKEIQEETTQDHTLQQLKQVIIIGERYQRLSLYGGIRPDVIDLESILMREENRSTRKKTLGVRLRSTETQPTYDLEARVEPGSQRWEAQMITTKPP